MPYDMSVALFRFPPLPFLSTYIWIAKALTKTVDNMTPLLRKKVLDGGLAEVCGWCDENVESVTCRWWRRAVIIAVSMSLHGG